jgi:hypothetical protein
LAVGKTVGNSVGCIVGTVDGDVVGAQVPQSAGHSDSIREHAPDAPLSLHNIASRTPPQ